MIHTVRQKNMYPIGSIYITRLFFWREEALHPYRRARRRGNRLDVEEPPRALRWDEVFGVVHHALSPRDVVDRRHDGLPGQTFSAGGGYFLSSLLGGDDGGGFDGVRASAAAVFGGGRR